MPITPKTGSLFHAESHTITGTSPAPLYRPCLSGCPAAIPVFWPYAVVPNRSNRKQPFRFEKKAYKQRHRIENAFCRLKDFKRIATRYDRLARNFLASVCLVAAIVWWIL